MQPTTERMTRSRARTLAATGQTPALNALPDKTPATTRTTRRRAAAAAAAPAETEGAVAPVVLFDVTNEQTGSPAQPPLTARDAPAAVQAPATAGGPGAAPQPEQAVHAPAAAPAEPAAPASEEPAQPASPAPAVAEEGAAVPASPAPVTAAEEPAAEEPPATPATAPTSPAPPAPGATPTGLGLSTLPPLSPSPPLAFQFQAATPAATPLAGLHDDHQAKVADALAAAVEALGGASPTSAASPAPAACHGGEPMFCGFGSPLKQEEGDSPALLHPVPAVSAGPSVSIGAAIGAADTLMVDDAMSSPAPEVGLEAAFERELTLEEMMGTPPGASDHDDTLAAASAPTPGVLVRTAAKAHPLTPARQVVLEEEEQDYIMQTEEGAEGEAAAAAPSPAPTPSPATAVQPSPAPTTAPGLSPAVLYLAPSAAASPAPALAAAAPAPSPAALPSPAPAAEAAAEVAAQAQPRVGSKVVLPSPGMYDPRSLRQLKREVADRLAAKQAVAPHLFAEDEDDDGDGEYIGTPSGDDLADELGALSLEGGNKLLRGLPTPAGTHIRFDEEGDVAAVSPRQRVYLRGMPQPAGTHIKFDE